MSLVIDASVALKWLLDGEEDVEAAEALFHEGPLMAPDFLLLECANVLAMKVRSGGLSQSRATASLADLGEIGLALHPSATHVPRAHALAMELGQTAYDCLYLALALTEGAILVTADGRFSKGALGSPAYAPWVRAL